ncbi:recombinase family protein [Aneurinibacillus thermoaerophilus]|uniref:Recombinase family protein n=2 Tax=Bacillales TaxID=1385 RepID=A0ABX8YDF5_ANETH|nr:recombinase family protein [Aneurinibacillus thermoaerophilus]AMA74039.1 recombinase [Aneurinibacillus sp. XH2]MED0675851.1 recombinase family protein [Aneurinibacillus thermoaerophilus]MED0737906.1 recombinase family protein [Aneurinibacillus thermoaerophilus]QYY43375.1 recombinase family protein [Aneurinibacillus thermoaerophilus]
MYRPTGKDVFIYLRKSRKDIEEEKKALENGRQYDTLSKHRKELLELVKREQHNVIDIFEEVVSGEFLSERHVAQEMLRQVEEGAVEGVVVMDLDRLGRGDMIDAGTIFRAFKFSDTLIITPNEVIDCNSEGAELLFGVKSIIAREELKQINKRLQGGRRRSAKDGKSITRKPPYGYIRDENLKLHPHPEEAPVVRKIFELAAEGNGRQAVVKKLELLGIQPPEGKVWEQSTISYIIKNEVYLGHIVWGKHKYIKRNGKRIRKNVPPELWIRHENAHEPIISKDLFEQANLALSGRYRTPTKEGSQLTNPLAGIVKCSVCGRSLRYVYSKERRPQLRCINLHCQSVQKGALFHLIEERVINSLHMLVEQATLQQDELAASLQKEESIIERKQKQISKLEREIQELHGMRDTAFEMLEKKVYTEEIFLQRHQTISQKIKEAEANIEQLKKEIELEEAQLHHQKNILPQIQKVVDTYWEIESPVEKNHLLKSILEKVYYTRKKEWTKKDQFELEIVPRLPI